jgi:predicted acetyltransferase
MQTGIGRKTILMELLESSDKILDKIEAFLPHLGKGENGFSGTNFGEYGFDIEEYIESLRKHSSGEGLRSGYIPQTTFWLLDDNGKIVGISRMRHGLTPSLEIRGGHIGYFIGKDERGKGFGEVLLKLTIAKASGLGLDEVLVTTDSQNFASIRIIEKCGGVMKDELTDERSGNKYRRYWIKT